MVVIDNKNYITEYNLLSEEEQESVRILYSPDMFASSRDIIGKHGYAVAVDTEGNVICALREEITTYVHAYRYSGGLDMWFLDQYDCLFLHDCNEYSVELCRNVLQLWQGTRLVLVGKDWAGLILQLPDLPAIECYYEEKLTAERCVELINGGTSLHLMTGLPHEEKMERFESGIMFYDEVMSFTFMFSDYRELGDKNEDKEFFVMDGLYGSLGLFALFGKAVTGAKYAKSRGFIPVIQVKRARGSFYQNVFGEDIWDKFYNQPEGYTVEEVMSSRHVYLAPIFYNASIQSRIMNLVVGETELAWPNGIYNNKVWAYINEREKKFLPYPEKTLGVLARGTDYANTKFQNHAIHATKEQLGDKIDEVWNSWGGFEYIYIATEDESYCEYFRQRYGDRVFFTDQQRYITKTGEMLAQLHKSAENKRDGFLMGAEYILAVYLLSQCRALLASGQCAGVSEALHANGGKYEHTYIFQLGVNP